MHLILCLYTASRSPGSSARIAALSSEQNSRPPGGPPGQKSWSEVQTRCAAARRPSGASIRTRRPRFGRSRRGMASAGIFGSQVDPALETAQSGDALDLGPARWAQAQRPCLCSGGSRPDSASRHKYSWGSECGLAGHDSPAAPVVAAASSPNALAPGSRGRAVQEAVQRTKEVPSSLR